MQKEMERILMAIFFNQNHLRQSTIYRQFYKRLGYNKTKLLLDDLKERKFIEVSDSFVSLTSEGRKTLGVKDYE
jgi:hypothetical protein